MKSLRVLARLLVIAIGLALGLAGFICWDGLHDERKPSDVAVVLGSKVEPTGQPSERLLARLDAAAALYQRGWVHHVIVSGATGPEGHNEALVMQRYLVDSARLPEHAVLVDMAGTTTQATARNAASLMKARGFQRAVVVSQYFHITRCKLAMRRAGITDLSSTHPSYFEWRDLYSVMRETVAVPLYWLH
jgi:vancomycin permeability regulator SanA